jgi:hypothetical protein
MSFITIFMLIFFILCVCFFIFYFLCVLCFCVVLCTVFPLVLSLSYLIQVYQPMPAGGNPVAGNKCHINVVMMRIILFNWRVQQKEVRMTCWKFVTQGD